MILKLSLLSVFLICFLTCSQFNLIEASTGDEMPEYLLCYIKCSLTNCQPNITKKYDNETESYTEVENLNAFERNQSYYMYLFGWDCVDECRYSCMWEIMDNLTKSGNLSDGIPQFGGKWPFVRILFMQEPFSVFASLLNLIINVYLLKKYYKNAPNKKTFIKFIWYMFSFVSMGYWLCSISYHIRDCMTTLNLDTFGAFFFIVFYFNTFLIRLLWAKKGYLSKIASLALTCLLVYSFYSHVDHMINVHFDFDYNIQVMLFVNGVNSVCWLAWSAYQYYRLKQKYVWRCALSIIMLNFFVLLEFWEFEPLVYFVDSHSLWHLSTVIIPVYWYKFLVDDLHRLVQESNEINKKLN